MIKSTTRSGNNYSNYQNNGQNIQLKEKLQVILLVVYFVGRFFSTQAVNSGGISERLKK